MSSRLQKLLAFLSAYRRMDELELGDFAIIKSEAFGVKIPEGVDARLDPVRGYLPRLTIEQLRAMPAGTLGQAVAKQLDDNGFRLFAVSEAMRERVEEQTYILRYLATHDFIHVLTGFDTSLCGEMGVLAVTVEQGFAPAGAFQEAMARTVYPLRVPSQYAAIRHNRALGHELGRRAEFLLAIRYEDYLDQPVEQVRKLLNIPDPALSGVLRAT